MFNKTGKVNATAIRSKKDVPRQIQNVTPQGDIIDSMVPDLADLGSKLVPELVRLFRGQGVLPFCQVIDSWQKPLTHIVVPCHDNGKNGVGVNDCALCVDGQ